TITKQQNRLRQVFSPSVMFTWSSRDRLLGKVSPFMPVPIAGLGFDGSDPNVFAGLAWIYQTNLALNEGIGMTKVKKLLGSLTPALSQPVQYLHHPRPLLTGRQSPGGRGDAVANGPALVGLGVTELRGDDIRDDLHLRLRKRYQIRQIAQQPFRRPALQLFDERLQFRECSGIDRLQDRKS